VAKFALLNICSHIGTPLGDRELKEFRDRGQGTINSSFFYHYARLIEILVCIEQIEQLLEDSDLNSDRLRAKPPEALYFTTIMFLGCSTHAVGQMPLHVQLFDAEENLLEDVCQN
jgi:coenzyme F420-reducing hydrogenase alpha subunit